MNMLNKTRSRAAWIIAALSLAPLAVYLYLGHFSRLMLDDYGLFAAPLHLGFLDNFFHWRNNWFPSYTFYVVQDLLTPLDPARLPALLPAAVILAWFAGLTWLISLALRHLELTRDRLPISIALSALMVFASIRSFHTLESFYWFTASLRHTLPVGFMLLFLAVALELGENRGKAAAAVAAAAGLLFGIVNSGFSELNVVIQLVFAPVVIFGMRRYSPGLLRRLGVILLWAAFCGSLFSLVVQLTAPGMTVRTGEAFSIPYQDPIRDPFELVLKTAVSFIDQIGYPDRVVSFALMFASGLLTALLFYRPKTTSAPLQTISLNTAPLAAGLFLQLAFVPLFWSLSGEGTGCGVGSCELLGSFRALHVLSLVGYSLLLWRRPRVESLLTRRLAGMQHQSKMIMLVVASLLALTQIRAMPPAGVAYLFLSAFVLVMIFASHLHSVTTGGRSRQYGNFALSALALAAVTLAISVAIGHFGLGYVFLRSLSFSVMLQALLGLIWGGYIGYLAQRGGLLAKVDPQVTTHWVALGLVLIAAVVIVIVADEARQIPDFATHAREWDARHQRIIELRDSGQRHIEVKPYTFDLTTYVMASGSEVAISHPYYYSVDSITVID